MRQDDFTNYSELNGLRKVLGVLKISSISFLPASFLLLHGTIMRKRIRHCGGAREDESITLNGCGEAAKEKYLRATQEIAGVADKR